MNMPELKGAGMSEAYAWWKKQEADGVDINALTMAMRLDRVIARMLSHTGADNVTVFSVGADADAFMHQLKAFEETGYTLERIEKAILYVRQQNGDNNPVRMLSDVIEIANRMLERRNILSKRCKENHNEDNRRG